MIESIEKIYKLFKQCSGISTDTRGILQGSMFIALKGPNFNANQFAQEALDKGAKYALVDDPEYATQSDIFLVSDGLQTLQQLASHHRSQLKIPIIGITGSNGKTTTKELIFEVLKTSYRTSATIGNLNNHIGVPLSILAIKPEIEISIIEMGANHVGEIAALCRIARPTHGLITNIGRAHIEGFGGFEGVIRGKSELYQHLLQENGVVFINSADPILANMAKRFDNPLCYPGEGDFLNIVNLGSDPYLIFQGESGQKVSTQLIGDYNFNNVAAALCVGKHFEVPMDLAERAVANYLPENNRSQVIRKGTNTVILDAYNANPSSMTAAINNLIAMDAPNKMVILGDMMELGDESDQSHQEIVKLTNRSIQLTLLVGPLMKNAVSANPDAKHFKDKTQLFSYLKTQEINNYTILIKASRSIGLEEVVDVL